MVRAVCRTGPSDEWPPPSEAAGVGRQWPQGSTGQPTWVASTPSIAAGSAESAAQAT